MKPDAIKGYKLEVEGPQSPEETVSRARERTDRESNQERNESATVAHDDFGIERTLELTSGHNLPVCDLLRLDQVSAECT